MSYITINRFMESQNLSAGNHGEVAGQNMNPDLIPIIDDIATACRQIAGAISRGAIDGTMHSLDSENIQGEVQKALDMITNDIFLEVNQSRGYMAGMASEEMDEPYVIPQQFRNARNPGQAKYLMLFDPLDGSSNVNLNMTVGTIFSILRCPADIAEPTLEDFLQSGTQQVCAGYALYGTSTMLVLTTGSGVNGFTLDMANNEFVMTHPNMLIPQDTEEFAVNMSNYRFWEAPMQDYIDECLQGKKGPRGKDFNMRWVGAMVAEIHRLLIRGGIYMYPVDSRLKKQGGRLRLMYEANPLGFIVEQAGGVASTGHERIMDIKPTGLHQRIAVIMGAKTEADLLISYHAR
jgi:fructose-1,6-bisphosphatase I